MNAAEGSQRLDALAPHHRITQLRRAPEEDHPAFSTHDGDSTDRAGGYNVAVASSEHPIDHRGRPIDFGKTARDYDRYRPGFPASMYERLLALGWIRSEQKALDLGTGTGSLALGLAERGLDVVGLDPSSALLEVARRRAAERDLAVHWVEGTAEDTGLEAASFELVTAGQCWWWFDARRALTEIARVLRPGGRLLIANFSYLPSPESVAGRTEDLILEHNPGWPMAAQSGVYGSQLHDLDVGGFENIQSFSYTESVSFTHEAWRGRIRACNGVGASLTPTQVETFDRDLSSLLEREFPGELEIPHRVFVASGRA